VRKRQVIKEVAGDASHTTQAYDAEQKTQWKAMIDESTVDCYDEHEEFAGMLATLEDRLEFPFQAKILGKRLRSWD
jgi:5,10-methenyltetrahydromethanopterin hydrogenase